MKQTEERMAPNHWLPRTRVRRRDRYLTRLCMNRNVVHLACAAWPFTTELLANGELLHAKLDDVCEKLAGVDICSDGLAILRQRFGNLHEADLLCVEQFQSFVDQLSWTPDIFVAGELIEHLDQPGQLLENCQRVMPRTAKLAITVPNAFSAKSFLRVAVGIEKVTADHVAYYSMTNLRELVSRAGFELLDTVWYRAEGNVHVAERAVDLAMKPCLWACPQLADGLIVVCRPKVTC